MLFTNGQLAAVARGRPRTRAALAEVEGVGEARVRDYADEVIAVVAGVPLSAAPEEEASDGAAPAGS